MPTPVKVAVVHRKGLQAKYGAAGWRRVRAALTTLVAADKARGLSTRVLAVDSAADAKRVGVPTVAGSAVNAAAVKRFVDGVTARLAPEYVLLVGAPDTLPQAELDNPLWTGNALDDPDPVVPSDLPYACDAALSRTIADFRGPTRVVGRLPDLLGASDPGYLLRLLTSAQRWTSAAAAHPVSLFALSTRTWQQSTQLSVDTLAGAAGVVRLCPREGPVWTKADLGTPLVFVNCHGAEFDPTWYGEQSASQQTLPPAMKAGLLSGLVAAGTVVASEACYGAAHWPPAAAGGQPGVAATWLSEGAVGVFASSTTSYGPARGNANADVITRLFLEAVVAGASLGRAALVARQRYVAAASPLSPTDLKTLAQFDLWGDPSVHPIQPPQDVPKGRVARVPGGGAARRLVVTSMGHTLERAVAATGDALDRPGLSARRLAGLAGVEPAGVRVRSFAVDVGAAADAEAQQYHVAFVGRAGRRAVVEVATRPGEPPQTRRLELK